MYVPGFKTAISSVASDYHVVLQKNLPLTATLYYITNIEFDDLKCE